MKWYSVHSENGIGPQKNTNTVYSVYSSSGIVPKARALRVIGENSLCLEAKCVRVIEEK